MLNWLRQNLFQNLFNSVVSVALLGFTFYCLSAVFEWSLVNSVWQANSIDECNAIIAAKRGQGSSGACWAVFGRSFNYFAFGFYPTELHWRPIITAVLAAAILMVAISGRWVRPVILAALTYPIIATWLIWGGFGLDFVQTPKIGGFTLMLLMVAYAGPVALTVGFALALAQRFLILPARALATTVSQFFNAIPPVVLIFAGIIFSNYLLPPGVSIDTFTLASCLIGLASASPVAHVLSNSLAHVPKGQMDAAQSLGFSERRGFWLVIIPLAITNAAPQLSMIVAKLVRDTSLLIIAGFLDPIGLISTQRADSAWHGIFWELFIVVGGAYWIFSFAIAMLGKRLEQKQIRRAGGDRARVLKAKGALVACS